MTDEHQFKRWQKRHPEFDLQKYSYWIKAHGYYQAALDISKPEFYEYASRFLQTEQATRMTFSS